MVNLNKTVEDSASYVTEIVLVTGDENWTKQNKLFTIGSYIQIKESQNIKLANKT